MDFENVYKLNEVISGQTYGGEFGDLDDNDNEMAFDVKYEDSVDIMEKAINKIAQKFHFSNLTPDKLQLIADDFVSLLITKEEDLS